jgi:hypothetical protein
MYRSSDGDGSRICRAVALVLLLVLMSKLNKNMNNVNNVIGMHIKLEPRRGLPLW